MKCYHNGVTDLIMSVTLILISIGEIYLMNVSHDTIVSNKHEEQTRHDYVCQFPTMLSATLPHASAEVSFPGFSQEREVQHPVSSS